MLPLHKTDYFLSITLYTHRTASLFKKSVTSTEGQTGNIEVSVKVEEMVNLTLTARLSLHKLE